MLTNRRTFIAGLLCTTAIPLLPVIGEQDNRFVGGIRNFWLSEEYIDFSLAENRALFLPPAHAL